MEWKKQEGPKQRIINPSIYAQTKSYEVDYYSWSGKETEKSEE